MDWKINPIRLLTMIQREIEMKYTKHHGKHHEKKEHHAEKMHEHMKMGHKAMKEAEHHLKKMIACHKKYK